MLRTTLTISYVIHHRVRRSVGTSNDDTCSTDMTSKPTKAIVFCLNDLKAVKYQIHCAINNNANAIVLSYNKNT